MTTTAAIEMRWFGTRHCVTSPRQITTPILLAATEKTLATDAWFQCDQRRRENHRPGVHTYDTCKDCRSHPHGRRGRARDLCRAEGILWGSVTIASIPYLATLPSSVRSAGERFLTQFRGSVYRGRRREAPALRIRWAVTDATRLSDQGNDHR